MTVYRDVFVRKIKIPVQWVVNRVAMTLGWDTVACLMRYPKSKSNKIESILLRIRFCVSSLVVFVYFWAILHLGRASLAGLYSWRSLLACFHPQENICLVLRPLRGSQHLGYKCLSFVKVLQLLLYRFLFISGLLI